MTTAAPNPKSRAHRAARIDDMLQELAEMGGDVFADQLPHSPEDFARRFLERLRERWGGRDLWIPAGDSSKRDAAIRQQFNGRNLMAVCNQHGVSPSTVYRICGRRGYGQ